MTVLDDSLLLAYRRGKAVSAREAALSVSAVKQYEEDPHYFYLRRVLGLPEPEQLPLVFGNAVHTGMEAFCAARERRTERALYAFRDELVAAWPRIEDPKERYNPARPDLAAGKKDVPVTLADMIERGARMLYDTCSMLEAGWDRYTPTQLVRPGAETERALGELAYERGMPSVEMTLFDSRTRRRQTTRVATIGGVPVHGYVDLVLDWPDGSKMIVDHKTVGHIVSYYPGGRFYEPSYNPATDLQLDVYACATGITRAGFQFMTKLPQHLPETNVLYPDWLDEAAWLRLDDASHRLPMAWARSSSGELRYVLVWRPAPEDHPSRPSAYTREALLPRTTYALRRAAEALTESFVLLEEGADPAIAFPPGDPSEIARKKCAYCIFNSGRTEGAACGVPSDAPGAHVRRERLLAEREAHCRRSRRIAELRAHWKAHYDPLGLAA